MVVTWSSARSLQDKLGLPLLNQIAGWVILGELESSVPCIDAEESCSVSDARTSPARSPSRPAVLRATTRPSVSLRMRSQMHYSPNDLSQLRLCTSFYHPQPFLRGALFRSLLHDAVPVDLRRVPTGQLEVIDEGTHRGGSP